MRLRHLAGADAHALYEERPRRPTHTLKVLLLEPAGGTLDIDRVRAHVRARIAGMPTLRWVAVPMPGGLFHPVWVDRGMPDLDVHVQPGPPGASLEAVAGALAGSLLARDRPLWRLWLVPDLGSGSPAVVFQVSHALADGAASARLLEGLFGADEPQGAPGDSPPEPMPARARLLRSGAVRLLRLLVGLPGHVRLSVRAMGSKRRYEATQQTQAIGAFCGPGLAWSGPLTTGRAAAWTSISLADAQRTRAAFGASVGELVLAVVAGALRLHLEGADGGLPSLSLTAVVPVTPRSSIENSGNRHTTVFVSLATDVADPAARISVIAGSLRAARGRLSAGDIAVWNGWWEYYPLFRALYLATVIPMGRLLRKPPASLIVSTVRGPGAALRIAGLRVTEIHSISELADHLGLNVTVWSYADRLSFGLCCARAHAPLAGALADRIDEAFAELSAGAAVTGA